LLSHAEELKCGPRVATRLVFALYLAPPNRLTWPGPGWAFFKELTR